MTLACFNHRDVCNAACCRSYEVWIPYEAWMHYERDNGYYSNHGLIKLRVVQPFPRKRFIVALVTNSACRHLTSDNRCSVWGTDKMPKICDSNLENVHSSAIHIPARCIFNGGQDEKETNKSKSN